MYFLHSSTFLMTGVLFLGSWLSLWKSRRLHKLWANPVSPSKDLSYQKLGENLLGEQKSEVRAGRVSLCFSSLSLICSALCQAPCTWPAHLPVLLLTSSNSPWHEGPSLYSSSVSGMEHFPCDPGITLFLLAQTFLLLRQSFSV